VGNVSRVRCVAGGRTALAHPLDRLDHLDHLDRQPNSQRVT
jgi:hypothetical protein